uniref:RRM domain-containing protein n=1 Tax=Anopheles coluzzii TaxID=1518534 RepID=A0A8W7PWR0_ANOCL
MAERRSGGTSRNNFTEEKSSADTPPMSRLFIICSKSVTEENLREHFDKFGDIEEIWIVKDRATGEGKGAGAGVFGGAVNSANGFADDRRVGPGGGGVGSVSGAGAMMGFAAMGGNDRRSGAGGAVDRRGGGNDFGAFSGYGGAGGNSAMVPNGNETMLTVLCSPVLNQDQLWRLFDIIPGLDYCQINNDFNNRNVTATVVYNNSQSAMYARDKIHGLEYPPGERLIIRLGHETVGTMGVGGVVGGVGGVGVGVGGVGVGVGGGGAVEPFNGNDREAAFCSVPLPPPQPLANANAEVAQRCFIVCIPKALPTSVLKQTFCRFGDLIDVYLLPNKNCGYAKYASEESAKKAIKQLHGADILNVRLKVLEAEEPSNDRRKRMRHDERMENE